jgi:hypothetical protein
MSPQRVQLSQLHRTTLFSPPRSMPSVVPASKRFPRLFMGRREKRQPKLPDGRHAAKYFLSLGMIDLPALIFSFSHYEMVGNGWPFAVDNGV